MRARYYVIRLAEHSSDTYLALSLDDVAEAFRRATGYGKLGDRFAEDGVLFQLDWGSCTVTGTPFELRLRFDGATTARLADGFAERLVNALEEVSGEPYDWERQSVPSTG